MAASTLAALTIARLIALALGDRHRMLIQEHRPARRGEDEGE